MKISISRSEYYRHILIWAFICTILSITDPVRGSLIGSIIGTALILISYIVSFYLIVFSLDKWWDNSKFMAISFLILYYFVYFIIEYLILGIIGPSLGAKKIMSLETGMDVLFELYAIVITYSILLLMAFGYFFHKMSLKKLHNASEKEKEVFQKERIVLEKEKYILEKELTFIKNQFNSHITFNFLNYLYGFVYKNPDATDAIDNFSKILRYCLEINPGQLIDVQKEVEYVENYIKLQKIISTHVYVKFNVCIMEEKKIIPYLLIPLIENAFKHGITNDPNNPIEIYLNCNGYTELIVKNLKSKRRVISSGVGIKNLIKNLELNYEDRFHLDVNEEANYYQVNLKLVDHD